MQFSVSKTFVPSHVFENCYDIREIGALVSDVKFSNLPVPDGFGFSGRQTDPVQPEVTYRSIESQAALPVPLTTTGFIEFLASVGPGEDETEPSMLRIYCDKVLSKYVVLNDKKWVKVQLNVGDRPEDLASLLHFEVDFASKGHNLRKPRPVRITNPVAVSQTQGAEANPDVSKMLANVDSRIQDGPTLMSVANRK